MRDHFSFQERI